MNRRTGVLPPRCARPPFQPDSTGASADPAGLPRGATLIVHEPDSTEGAPFHEEDKD